MTRRRTILASVAGLLFLAPLLAGLGLVGAANTATGRRAIERLVPRLTGGTVVPQGLGGHFPDRPRLAHLDLRDGNGVWLSIDDLALDWSPSALLTARLSIGRIGAGLVDVRRRPLSTEDSSGGATLPLTIDIGEMHLGRLQLSPDIVENGAALQIDGRLDVSPSGKGRADLDARWIDSAGGLSATAVVENGRVDIHADLTEPAGGPVARLAGLPDLGPLSVKATLAGPSSAARLSLSAEAGPFTANGNGTIDLGERSLDITLAAHAPAMAPAPGLSWRSIGLEGTVSGSVDAPTANGRLTIDTLAAQGADVRSIDATLAGNTGKLHLDARLDGITLPGALATLLAGSPLAITADIGLDAPGTPVSFVFRHPLLGADGDVQFDGATTAKATITMPALAPIAQSAGLDLKGHARIDVRGSVEGDRTSLALSGIIGANDAERPLDALIGGETHLDAALTIDGGGIAVDHADVDGHALHVSGSGKVAGHALDLSWKAGLADLAVLSPDISGSLSADGTLKGDPEAPQLATTLKGEVAAAGLPRQRLDLALQAEGRPGTTSATASLAGTLGGERLAVAMATRPGRDGATDVDIERARLAGAEMRGRIRLTADRQGAEGEIGVQVAELSSLDRLTGLALSGTLGGTVSVTGRGARRTAHVDFQGGDLAIEETRIGHLSLKGDVGDPLNQPTLGLRLEANAIDKGGIGGNAILDANGGLSAVTLRLKGDFDLSGTKASIAVEGAFDAKAYRLGLRAIDARACGGRARLLAPAIVDFSDGVTVDGLTLGLGQTTATMSGRVSPRFDLAATLNGRANDLPTDCLPLPFSQGKLSAEVKLAGSPSDPAGSLRFGGTDLRLRGTGAIAPASVEASGELGGGRLRLSTEIKAGANADFHLSGTVPLSPGSPLDLEAKGTVDLAILAPIFLPDNRSVHGRLSLDSTIGGTLAAPCLSGSADLANGAVRDFSQGFALRGITARIEAQCESLRLVSLAAEAGKGRVTASGTLDLGASGMPVDLTISANHARPLASDLLTADIDADLALRGQLAGPLLIGGTIHILEAEINIPDTLAGNVPVLDIRRPGEAPAPVREPAALGLDLILLAPERIFVRGRGIDAEMSGRLHIQGTTAQPQISDGFDLRRGIYSLAAKTLDFQSGRVAFDGAGANGGLDPTLNFVAQSTSGSTTATLTVSGYADAPKITLSSTPALPQDEILAQLLFGQSVKQLSPLQIAQIAQSVAAMTNVAGGLDPLSVVRRNLGLDRLSAGSETSGSGASLQAGKYVSEGVYVGAQQGMSNGTRAQVQIDLTRNLKLETTIGTGNSTRTGETTTQNDPGSSVGLTYRFEY